MEQVLTPPYVRGLDTDEMAARLGRCAIIEDALVRALASGRHSGTHASAAAMLRHLEQDERHAARLRVELSPTRNGGGSSGCDSDLRHWLSQIAQARDEVEWLAGLYGVVKPVLADAYRDLIAAADPSRDRATVHLLQELLRDEEDQILWGLDQMRRLATGLAARDRADDWAEYLRLGLRAAGDIWGNMPRQTPPVRPGYSDRRAPVLQP
jgi:hypothetical protein